MKITQRTAGDITVLDLEGRIVLGEGDEVLRNKVREVIAAGSRKVLLNLGGVSYVDSAGLGELVRCHTRLAREGGEIKLVHLTERMEDLLQITKLVTVFETHDSEKDALASF